MRLHSIFETRGGYVKAKELCLAHRASGQREYHKPELLDKMFDIFSIIYIGFLGVAW